MTELKNLLSAFEPITLAEMDGVKLMDRVDTKYVFSSALLPDILEKMKSDYRLLEIDTIRLHRYESLYYDTPDFKLYAKHQRGILNRWKFRFRKYVDSAGLTFFELKFKNNKARTIKSRTKVHEVVLNEGNKAAVFLNETTPFSAASLEPKMWVNYSRMTFVNKFSEERLTMDVNLNYIRANDNQNISFPHMVIAEAKRANASYISSFIRMVRRNGIREGSISKYCFGIYNLFDSVKKNNFKPRVRFIHKMAATKQI